MRGWVGAVVAAVAGFILGYAALGGLIPPTDAGLQDAARSLQPPGYVIADEYTGGGSSLRGQFFAGFDSAPEAQPLEERVDAYIGHAKSLGWTESTHATGLGADSYTLTKGNMRAGYSFRHAPQQPDLVITGVSVRATDAADGRRGSLAGLLGALIGVGVWGFIAVRDRRRADKNPEPGTAA